MQWDGVRIESAARGTEFRVTFAIRLPPPHPTLLFTTEKRVGSGEAYAIEEREVEPLDHLRPPSNPSTIL